MDIKEKIIEFVKNIPEIEIVLLDDEYGEIHLVIYLNKVCYEIYDDIYDFITDLDIYNFYITTAFCDYDGNEKYEDSLTHFREHNVIEIIYDKESII